MRLGELLARKTLVPLEQLRRAQTRSRHKLALALVETGAVDERALVRVVSKFHNIPAVAIDAYTAVDPDVARLVPKEVCERLDALPLRMDGDKLVVAVVDPSNAAGLDDIRFMTGSELSLVVTSPRDMQQALAHYAPPQHAPWTPTPLTTTPAPTTLVPIPAAQAKV